MVETGLAFHIGAALATRDDIISSPRQRASRGRAQRPLQLEVNVMPQGIADLHQETTRCSACRKIIILSRIEPDGRIYSEYMDGEGRCFKCSGKARKGKNGTAALD